MKHKQNSRGFGIIEVIISIAVVAIVASLTYIGLTNIKDTPEASQSDDVATEKVVTSDGVTANDPQTVQGESAAAVVRFSYKQYYGNLISEVSYDGRLADFVEYTTDELAATLRDAKGGDPVICTQNTPNDITFSDPVIKDSLTQVTVISEFDSGNSQALVAVDANDKITDISCL